MKNLCCIIFSLLYINTIAQTNWTSKKLFEQKNFIENKGQNDFDTLPNHQTILFTSNIDGVTYFFTKSGYTIAHAEAEKLNNKIDNKEASAPNEKEEEERGKYKIVKKYHELKWVNANPEVVVIAENKMFNYYSYSDLKSPDKNGTITAHAYKKIIYKNIYPNIDIQFEFPKDSTGIKYSIYLYPSADVGKIKMIFPNEKFSLNKLNDLEITSELGNIIDHKPSSFIADSKTKVKSNFKIVENNVGFEIDSKQTNQTIVIDPWTVTPNFLNSNKAYDIDYDNQGNVYVYGGYGWETPYKLLKYNATGALVWIYISPVSGDLYGDFTIDRNSNNIYLSEGFYGNGAHVVKINSNAMVLKTFSSYPHFDEIWRIAYSDCSNQLILAGGGPESINQTGLLDTNLIHFTPIQFVPNASGRHDIALLALDRYGNCYEGTILHSDGKFSNQLVKFKLPSLLPVVFHVNANYDFREGQTNLYYNYHGSIGYNGLTTSGKFVYSYDSYVLKKWNESTGQLLANKRINYPVSGDSSRIYWGGISADDCGNLFLADSNIVRQYDTTLTLVNSYTMPGVITDVSLNTNSLLYVCGLGFAASVKPTNLITCGNLKITTNTINSTCNTLGSATIEVTGGSPPYNIAWDATPVQNGATISNIQPGTYTVSATEGSCKNQTLVNSVTILKDDFSKSSSGNIQCGQSYTLPWGTIVNTPGIYYDSLMTIGGCDSVITVVLIYDISTLDIKTLIPNAFSPNDDGLNDQLCIPDNRCIEKINLIIYDRWGEKVFETNSLDDCWNGTYKGKKLEPAVFAYYFTVEFAGGTNAKRKGNISLIK